MYNWNQNTINYYKQSPLSLSACGFPEMTKTSLATIVAKQCIVRACIAMQVAGQGVQYHIFRRAECVLSLP